MNYAALTAFIIGGFCTSVYVFFLMPKQFNEVLRPKNYLTRLRWIILAILLISIGTSIPGLLYQYGRIGGQDFQVLRNVATITSNVSRLATTILLVLVYTYRKEE